MQTAKAGKADLLLFPELSVCGYPPEDLLYSEAFLKACEAVVARLAKLSGPVLTLLGTPFREKGVLGNCAVALQYGKIRAIYHKNRLPNYSVFDEKRYFTAGTKPLILKQGNKRIGVTICEDMWDKKGPLEALGKKGVDLIVNLSASPYHRGKIQEREKLLVQFAKQYHIAAAYCNLVGGQDELVFDGGSFVVNHHGRVIARSPQFQEDRLSVNLSDSKKPSPSPYLNQVEEVYQALILGIQDYAFKNGFKKALLGLSGGIDSALVAVLAAEALGKENVLGITLPTRYSSVGTKGDAKRLADRIGMPFREIAIQGLFEQYKKLLTVDFRGLSEGLAEENLQARIRANLLMAYSNKFNMLLLSTGNKSEASVGYCTLYGDMAGGFSPIKDLPKALVYELSHYCNRMFGFDIIPKSVIRRPPTAELRPNQKDSDSLPAYHELDAILQLHVEANLDADAICKKGFNKSVVADVLRKVKISEYKRRQSAPGIKITPLAFGKDRRMPITNQFDR